MSPTSPADKPTPVGVGLGVISEALVPGGSHLIKGDLSQGALHLLLGIAAGAFFGPIGLLAVRANSIAKSTTGKSVLEHVTEPNK